MTYVIKASTFGGGFSIYRLEVKDGEPVEHYLADAITLGEAKGLCPGATRVICPEDRKPRIVNSHQLAMSA